MAACFSFSVESAACWSMTSVMVVPSPGPAGRSGGTEEPCRATQILRIGAHTQLVRAEGRRRLRVRAYAVQPGDRGRAGVAAGEVELAVDVLEVPLDGADAEGQGHRDGL